MRLEARKSPDSEHEYCKQKGVAPFTLQIQTRVPRGRKASIVRSTLSFVLCTATTTTITTATTATANSNTNTTVPGSWSEKPEHVHGIDLDRCCTDRAHRNTEGFAGFAPHSSKAQQTSWCFFVLSLSRACAHPLFPFRLPCTVLDKYGGNYS